MNKREMKKTLRKNGIKWQKYELNEGTSKKDTLLAEYIKFMMQKEKRNEPK